MGQSCQYQHERIRVEQSADLLSLTMHGRFDPIATLDHVGLEANGSRAAVKLQEEPASITKH
jgi:hypothetical protein